MKKIVLILAYMKKNTIFCLLLCGILLFLASCDSNNPDPDRLIGTWSEPYNVNEMVKSLTFNHDGTLIYIDKPDTTRPFVITYGGEYKQLHYSVQESQLYISGYNKVITVGDTIKTDSIAFNYSTSYSIKGNVLTIDRFSYDYSLVTPVISPFVLYKQK